MSGKTTFIKTVGINLILAQTFYFTLSRKFSVPKYFVKSAINRSEDLENKKSYFFVEVEELQKFLELSSTSEKYVFLIDEIFRGTNTIERLAASTAVLSELNKKSLVFVTTHDIELQELLQQNFEMIHLSEQVKDNEYYFDYKIRKGPCSSGNAIKLLELKNYPAGVVKQANEVANKLMVESGNDWIQQ